MCSYSVTFTSQEEKNLPPTMMTRLLPTQQRSRSSSGDSWDSMDSSSGVEVSNGDERRKSSSSKSSSLQRNNNGSTNIQHQHHNHHNHNNHKLLKVATTRRKKATTIFHRRTTLKGRSSRAPLAGAADPTDMTPFGRLVWAFLILGLAATVCNLVYVATLVLDKHDNMMRMHDESNNQQLPGGDGGDSEDIRGGGSSVDGDIGVSPEVEAIIGGDVAHHHHHHLDLNPGHDRRDRPWIQPGVVEEKGPLLHLLREAGFEDLDAETIDRLPAWKDVADMYGNEPRILGLDQCERFQNSGVASDHFLAVAGTFNTGTNLMAELLINNCHMPERMKVHGKLSRGVRWQVNWGKHTPVGNETYRQEHRTYDDKDLMADHMFPAVMVRDPYKWLQSMCRHAYGAHWRHANDHCPSLVPNEADIAAHPALAKNPEAIPVYVNYADFDKHHASVIDFWNDWYAEYRQATFPYLFVRFEDVIYHPKAVTKTICECAGGRMNQRRPFVYITESAKKGSAHGKEKSGYLDALIKYGTEKGRYNGFEAADLDYMRQHLDPDLMKMFGYRYHPQDALERP